MYSEHVYKMFFCRNKHHNKLLCDITMYLRCNVNTSHRREQVLLILIRMKCCYRIEANGFVEASGSPPSSVRFISNHLDCSTRKIIHTRTHTLQTFKCYIVY